jgi:hypothetical protein
LAENPCGARIWGGVGERRREEWEEWERGEGRSGRSGEMGSSLKLSYCRNKYLK